ncbi:hypothetical protein BDN67DRAFT_1071243 [Paxillus ammoniavirescens]|nr:hypothetical protein BDN67DRAFT_1071243 [Paxillus ammoniavirescens]
MVQYTAYLANVPADYDRGLEACKATPLEIHDVSYLPSRCEDKGSHNIVGHWRVSHNEPDCNTYWRSREDKGCMSPGSRKRYIEYYLEMLPDGGDWNEFCATTPNREFGFQHVRHYYQRGEGTYGLWEVDDFNC